MTRQRWILIGLAASLLLNLAAAGAYLAERHRGGGAGRGDWAGSKLGLDKAELAALRSLRDVARRQMKDARDRSKAQDEAFARLLIEAAPGDPRLRAAAEALAKDRLDLQLAITDRFLAWRAGLAPDSRARLDKRLAKPGYLRRLLGGKESGPPGP